MEETFNPLALTRSDTATSTATLKLTTTNSKPTKPSINTASAAQTWPRIDYEPLYAELKSLISNDWDTYHEALSRLIRGELSSPEFSDLTDHFLLASPLTEHAHNSLICAIIHNIGRDSPESGPAAFISLAGEKTNAGREHGVGKSGVGAGGIGGDGSGIESRLKTEVMMLHARDRRRLKGITTNADVEDGGRARRDYEVSYSAARIQVPSTINTGATTAAATGQPAAGTGLADKNWTLEIRKRYAQPLFTETAEFPSDPHQLTTRITPICYENGLGGGCAAGVAELVQVGVETFVKNLLGDVVERVRCNMPLTGGYDSLGGVGEAVVTSSYRRKVMREDTESKKIGGGVGKIVRDRETELLPAELTAAMSKRSLGVSDLKLASRVGPSLWNGMPMVGNRMESMTWDADFPWHESISKAEEKANGVAVVNGHADQNGYTDGEDSGEEDDMELDDDDIGWEGAGRSDQAALGSLLGQCLELAGPVS